MASLEQIISQYNEKLEDITSRYDEKYKDRLHYNSFLNIWAGKRYSTVMPEVFKDKGRHTKLTPEIVHLIKQERE